MSAKRILYYRSPLRFFTIEIRQQDSLLTEALGGFIIETLRAFRRTGTHVRRSACPWPGVPEEKAVSE